MVVVPSPTQPTIRMADVEATVDSPVKPQVEPFIVNISVNSIDYTVDQPPDKLPTLAVVLEADKTKMFYITPAPMPLTLVTPSGNKIHLPTAVLPDTYGPPSYDHHVVIGMPEGFLNEMGPFIAGVWMLGLRSGLIIFGREVEGYGTHEVEVDLFDIVFPQPEPPAMM